MKKALSTFLKFRKDNTTLTLLINVTRGIKFSYMKNKMQKMYPAM